MSADWRIRSPLNGSQRRICTGWTRRKGGRLMRRACDKLTPIWDAVGYIGRGVGHRSG